MIVLSLITLVPTYLASETYREDITAERPGERRAVIRELEQRRSQMRRMG